MADPENLLSEWYLRFSQGRKKSVPQAVGLEVLRSLGLENPEHRRAYHRICHFPEPGFSPEEAQWLAHHARSSLFLWFAQQVVRHGRPDSLPDLEQAYLKRLRSGLGSTESAGGDNIAAGYLEEYLRHRGLLDEAKGE
ncbi:MAG: hypothetical protein ABIN58_06650, partial [candidate division WOR-3 bacterium]